MWKYCIETFESIRDLREPLWHFKHKEIITQRYFRKKAEAQKAMVKEIRDAKRRMSERRSEVGNCHEHVDIIRYKDRNYVWVGIHNRHLRTTEDQMVISWKQI